MWQARFWMTTSRPLSHLPIPSAVEAGGVTYPQDSRGVTVHQHADGVGYEVEFERPRFRVITLTAGDIRPERG